MFSQYLNGVSTVFMLHRVTAPEPQRLPSNERLKVSPEFLEQFIKTAKSKGYSFISLDTLYDALIQGKSMTKTIVLTLDDGYADNYVEAFPIFKKYEIPFIIYITTSFPDSSAILWWHTLEDVILENDALTLSDGTQFGCSTFEKKIQAFNEIRQRLIHLPNEDFLNALNALFAPKVIDWQAKVKELALNWDQIGEISEHPLATIGGHTINHFALATLTEKGVESEVIGCKQIIESHIHRPVEHFCYPFGGPKEVGIRDFELVKRLGFKTATTTRYGSIFAEHKEHLTALPRVMFNHEFSLLKYELNAVRRCWKARVVTV